MFTRSCARRLGLGALIGAALGAGLLLIAPASAQAAPAPTPAQPGAIVVLPGVLPPVQLPSLALPVVAPILDGVVSTVNGVGTTIQHTVSGVLTPTSRPGSGRPTGSAPAPVVPPGTGSSTASHRAAAGAARSSAPTAAQHRATAIVRRSNPERTPAAGTGTGNGTGSGAGSGAVRTGVVAPSSGVSGNPVTLVRQTADAVIHPGRVLLSLIAVTAICALGILALIASLGRRNR